MTDTPKVAALKTLLPELHNHIHLIDPIRSCLGNLPSTTPGDAPRVRPASPLEPWQQCERYWITAWRLDVVRDAFLALGEDRLTPYHAGLMYRCVYYRYVEPWDRFRAPRQDEHTAKGLNLMADAIPGELQPYQARYVAQERPREAKRRQVAEMLSSGFTVKRICHELRCSDRLVKAVSDALGVRS